MSRGVFLTLSACVLIASGCPSGWYGFGNSCYLFRVRSLNLRGLNWDNARSYCLNYGGDLVSVSNKSEMDFIYNKSSKASNEHYWIGLNDRRNESLFVWSDGTPYNRSVYSNWYKNEPNDRAGEDCVELYRTRWNDDSCKKEKSYICERPKGVPMPTFQTGSPPPTSEPIACPFGWVFYGSSCYLFSELKKKWTDAKKDCRESGGHLLTIDDATEQHFITIKQMHWQTSWIGLTDSAVEGIYSWESDNFLVNYTHWATEEPNDFGGVEDCVAVYAGVSAGFWNDDYCDSEHYYICEKVQGRNICPVNWRNFGDFCYKFNVHGALYKDWRSAENICMSSNPSTELLSITSEAEQAFILQQLRDMRVSRQVWLGLNDRKVEGRYEWSDKSVVKYKNWGANQPPMGGLSALIFDCTVIDPDTVNGTWSISSCSNFRGYICKRRLGIGQCNSPFGMEDGSIGDNQITASSSLNVSSRASQARLRLRNDNSTAGAWCAAHNKVGEYLQIDLGVVRQVQHIALQGRPESSDFVKTFFLRYGNNGLDFNNYGANATVKYTNLTGNRDAKAISNDGLPDPINARFIRIYPLTWSNRICIRTEIYGCASQASSKKCGVGWEIGLDDNCYQINSNQWKIWADARATCLSRGGDLVSIVSVREKNWLNDRLKALSSWAYTFWIGLNDRDISKHFYWSDRSPYRLTAWDRGYPRDYNLQNYKACVEIDASRGAWRDVSCGEYRPFICKKKMVSTDGNKFPVTGNWISATSYYWPLNALVDNGTKVAGTTPGYVYGNVMNKTDRYQVGRDALWFASYNAYVETGPFSDDCITDPSHCINGITVSFVGQFEDGAQMWTRNTFIVNTIGNEVLLQGKPGFAVYVANSQLYVTVVTPTKYWTLTESLTTGNTVWQHVMFCWQLEKGLALYINGTERSSLHQGKSSVYSGYTSLSLIVGSKSIQRTAGGFLVRSLALWKRSFSPREVNKIYLAELGSCQTGWNVFGQFCYQFNLDKKSWYAARLACVSQQAELASIHSPVEQAYITLEVGLYRLDAAWIGLNDKGVESEFKWSDSSNVEYTNWGANQPDDWFSREDCVHVRKNGRWNDLKCDSSLGYICKKPKEYIAPNKVPGNKAPQELYICEYTQNTLSCPSSTTLRVLSAFWGRTTAKICRYNAVTDCRLDVTSKIMARCEGKNRCLLEASVSLGPDPCFGVRKYLNISYVCEEGKVDRASCPTGWQSTLGDTRCFGLFFDRKNWQDSRRACQNLGGDLASFHSSTDNIVATSLLINSWDIGDIDGIWIGLTDAGQKGIYRWTDGTDVNYSSWLHGQPDERILSGSCVCATLQRGQMSSLFWKDVNCTLELPYVCSMYLSHDQASSPPPTTVPMVPCPFGWMYMSNGSFCYKLMAQSKTWTAARDACRAFGQNSDLVSIQSLAENNFVADIVVNGSASAFAVWIGLSDRGVLYGHTWSDKSPLKFTRWTPQQPDSHHGQQPCVEMYSTGEWGDTGCYSIKTFICKMPRPRKVVTSAPPLATAMQAPGICPPEWILWNTMCYYFSNGSLSGRKTWQEALRECQKIRGGDLVSIHSAAENSFIKSRSKMKTSFHFWIGLNDLGTEASFKWTDGSPVQYTNYNPREPNDFYHQEDCIEMLLLRGTWNDNHCSRSRAFICKKTNNTVVPAPNTIAPSTGPKLKSCKEGWINYGTSCYLFVSDNRQTWLNAQRICKQGLNDSTMGYLVTVDDQYEQAFLTTMLVGEKSYFWIGLNGLFHWDGTFFWADSSPVKYTNWGAKQPRTDGLNRPYCVMMNMFGRWINKNCYQTSGFVCETGALADDTNTTAVPSGNRTCPVHYELLDDDCLFVSYVKLSWQEAREACQRESNGNLMSVHSVFEQAFVVRALKNFNGGLWLGFVREANSAEFSWSDQSLSLYTAWASYEPNSPSSQKSCVVANNSNSNAGLWSDVDCAERNGFVCRISKGEPHISPAVLGSCPIGWEKFDKHCYLFRAEDRMSWASARYSCERRGGNLLSITSQQEQDYILYHYTSKTRGNVWIGLNDRALEAGYTWSDGSPVTFLNWNPGEPNDKNSFENCVEMYSNSRWNDKGCNVLNGYICRQPLECSGALGMVNGSITNGQVNASSRVSDLYSAKMARLNSSSAWCAGNDHPNQFIQVDLLTETRISKIATQGFILNGVDSYISTFKLQTCEDGINFYTYQKYGKDWVFIANRDANSIVTFAITPTINARLIRLVPITWKGSICLRMELYGCPFACETPLGIQSGALNDSDISASSSDNSDTATNARPSNDVGWCARASDAQPWLQISFPNRDTKITKITTWGGGRSSGYVKVYRLQFTDATGVNTWLYYREGGKIRNFRGNQDAVSPLTHRLAEPIITNNLRVKPLYWSVGGVCLRLEVFGCGSALLTTSSAPSAIPTSVSSVRPKEVLYSGSFKLSKEEWTENYNNPNSTEFNTLAAKLEKSIRQLYSGVDEASFAFRNVTVTGFRRGSVTVMFNLTFTRDMANELGANVTNNFVHAVRSGSMGEFAVDPKSLSIVKYESSGTTIGNPTTATQTEEPSGTTIGNATTAAQTGEFNETAIGNPTAAAQTGDKSSGLSRGVQAGISLAVLVFIGLCGGAVAWHFRGRKGKPLYEFQMINNPIHFSRLKQEVDTAIGD